MKNNLKSFLTPTLLGGAWGVFIYLVGSLILVQLPLTSFLFYPILFGGITGVIASTLESKIPLTKALVVGLISGFIYQILSPIFPFLSSVLVGASLGGGLVAEKGDLKDVFNRLLSILKGIFLFPVFIYVGGLLASLTSSIFSSHFLLWFFWGGWVSLGVCLIYMPLLKVSETEEDFETLSQVSEFKSEAQEILRDLNQLESKYK